MHLSWMWHVVHAVVLSLNVESVIFIYAVWRNVDSDMHIYIVKVTLISARCDIVFHIQ